MRCLAPEEIAQPPDQLTLAGLEIDAELGHQAQGQGELGEDEAADHELSDAEDPDAELGQGKHADPELADGEYPPSRHGHSVGAVFEGDVDQRPPEDGGG